MTKLTFRVLTLRQTNLNRSINQPALRIYFTLIHLIFCWIDSTQEMEPSLSCMKNKTNFTVIIILHRWFSVHSIWTMWFSYTVTSTLRSFQHHNKAVQRIVFVLSGYHHQMVFWCFGIETCWLIFSEENTDSSLVWLEGFNKWMSEDLGIPRVVSPRELCIA